MTKKKKDRYYFDRGRVGQRVLVFDRETGLGYDPEQFTLRNNKIVRKDVSVKKKRRLRKLV